MAIIRPYSRVVRVEGIPPLLVLPNQLLYLFPAEIHFLLNALDQLIHIRPSVPIQANAHQSRAMPQDSRQQPSGTVLLLFLVSSLPFYHVTFARLLVVSGQSLAFLGRSTSPPLLWVVFVAEFLLPNGRAFPRI